MLEQELHYFGILKQKVEHTFRTTHAACEAPIQDWKGKQISQFQDDLRDKVGGYVSEKWFYTHLKAAENKKLPRLDMLDLLVQYVGGKDWNDFIRTIEDESTQILPKAAKQAAANIWMLVVGLVGIILLLGLVSFFKQEQGYRFCIVDKDDAQAIPASTIKALWLKEEESPMELEVDSAGCVLFPLVTKQSVQLKIQALYYKPIVITRTFDGNQSNEESIALQKDDYALMIHYFSTNKMDDWEKRRQQLGMMLHDNVKIIQIHSNTGGGMALYNKQEFINKMTMPLKSLQNIELLATKYQGDQIIEIRFVQNNQKHE